MFCHLHKDVARRLSGRFRPGFPTPGGWRGVHLARAARSGDVKSHTYRPTPYSVLPRRACGDQPLHRRRIQDHDRRRVVVSVEEVREGGADYARKPAFSLSARPEPRDIPNAARPTFFIVRAGTTTSPTASGAARPRRRSTTSFRPGAAARGTGRARPSASPATPSRGGHTWTPTSRRALRGRKGKRDFRRALLFLAPLSFESVLLPLPNSRADAGGLREGAVGEGRGGPRPHPPQRGQDRRGGCGLKPKRRFAGASGCAGHQGGVDNSELRSILELRLRF